MHAVTSTTLQSPHTRPWSSRSGDIQRLAATRFTLHSKLTSGRAEVERYIAQGFAQHHGAQISHYLPELISLSCASSLCAAVGLTPAARGRLFAESYLDAPIEQLIAAASQQTVARDEVLEIGNLIASWKGSSLVLFVFLGELMHQLGVKWAVFTATPEVERLLAKLDFAPTVLANADPARIADAKENWGSYYQRAPRVVFGEIAPAVAVARRGALYRAMAKLLAPQVAEIAAQLRERSA